MNEPLKIKLHYMQLRIYKMKKKRKRKSRIHTYGQGTTSPRLPISVEVLPADLLCTFSTDGAAAGFSALASQC